MRTFYTGDDLMQLAPPGRFELVEGQLVEMTPPGGEHGEVSGNVVAVLRDHVRAHRLGRVLIGSGCYIRRNPDTVRGPDVSFYSFERIPPGPAPKGYLEVPPDLAVEVVSPNDSAEEVESRVQELLAAGVRRVWVLHPGPQSLTSHGPGGRVQRFTGQDQVVDDEILPGFSCHLDRFFEA